MLFNDNLDLIKGLNQTFAASCLAIGKPRFANIKKSFTGKTVMDGYVVVGEDFVVPTEKLEPIGIRLTDQGFLFLFKPESTDYGYDWLGVSLGLLEDSMPEIFEILLKTERLWNYGISALLSMLIVQTASKPSLKNVVNSTLAKDTNAVAELKSDVATQSLADFYKDAPDYGLFS